MTDSKSPPVGEDTELEPFSQHRGSEVQRLTDKDKNT